MQNFRLLSLKNSVYIWTCVRSSAKSTAWHRKYLVLVYTWYSISGDKFELILIPHNQFLDYLREPLYKYSLEHLEAARPDKKWVVFFSSHGKCLTIIGIVSETSSVAFKVMCYQHQSVLPFPRLGQQTGEGLTASALSSPGHVVTGLFPRRFAYMQDVFLLYH